MRLADQQAKQVESMMRGRSSGRWAVDKGLSIAKALSVLQVEPSWFVAIAVWSVVHRSWEQMSPCETCSGSAGSTKSRCELQTGLLVYCYTKIDARHCAVAFEGLPDAPAECPEESQELLPHQPVPP